MRRAFIAVLLAAAALGAALPIEATVSEVTLAVPDRSNQTPWAAALGPFVAVAWGAQPADGKLDVFVAVSRDSGRTFGAPVRVNDVEGEARLGGELPPRVALVPRSGGGSPRLWSPTDPRPLAPRSRCPGPRTEAARSHPLANCRRPVPPAIGDGMR